MPSPRLLGPLVVTVSPLPMGAPFGDYKGRVRVFRRTNQKYIGMAATWVNLLYLKFEFQPTNP